jgi:hypothetical protein
MNLRRDKSGGNVDSRSKLNRMWFDFEQLETCYQFDENFMNDLGYSVIW